jgi:hypothetical protein
MKGELVPDFLRRFGPALRRAVRNFKYEMTEGGILVGGASGLLIGGRFGVSVNDGPMEWDKNLIVNEGLNHILDVILHNQAQIATWYVALFGGNVTPAATWTAANFDSLATEFTNYDEATRVEYNEAAAAAQSITNSANKAAFTIGVGGGTVYGAALISSNVKEGTSGKLFAATRFATQRVLDATDILNVAYTVNAASS